MSDVPRVGIIIHAPPDPLMYGPNADHMSCRAAVVTGEEDDRGNLPVQVIPPWSNAYNANIQHWHFIHDCPRSIRNG
jgi:hypothetical protein